MVCRPVVTCLGNPCAVSAQVIGSRKIEGSIGSNHNQQITPEADRDLTVSKRHHKEGLPATVVQDSSLFPISKSSPDAEHRQAVCAGAG